MRKLMGLMVVTSLVGWGCANGPQQRAERETEQAQGASGERQATLPQQEATEEDEIFGRSYEDEQAQGTGGAAGAGTAAGTAQKQPDQPQQGAQPQARQLDESQWVAELMLANSWVVDMSRIAESQAATPSVRQLAQQLVQTHQRFEQQLQQIAQREGIDVAQGLRQTEQGMKKDFMHAAMLTSLAGLPTMTGVNLDRAYLSSIVLSHDLAIDKIQWAVKQVKNPRLAQAIQDELKMMVQNRQQAHRLLGQVAPELKRGQAHRHG